MRERRFRHTAKSCIVGALLLPPVSGWAGNQEAILEYGASLQQSHWEFDRKAGECRLTHLVPGFGLAVVRQEAGKDLEVVLAPKQPVSGPLRCRISVVPPTWRHGVDPQSLEELELAARQPRITVSGKSALALYQGLNDGLMDRFECRTAGEGTAVFTVQLSPVHYQEAAVRYRTCAETLAAQKTKHAAARETLAQGLTVLFPSGSARLSAAARSDLKRLAAYCIAHPDFRFLELAGYADQAGSKRLNQQLSQRRAAAVKSYLIQQGVPSRKLQLRFFGSSRPAAAGKDAASLARNRRVQITPIY